MTQPVRSILRRGLLAAGGTLLAAAVAGKCRATGTDGAGDGAQAADEAADGAAAPSPHAQALAAIRRESPRPLPALQFTDAAGAARTLAAYAGHGLVLNFWATWCAPCVAEMPALDALAPRLSAAGLLVLPVSLDRGGAAVVQAFYRSHAVTHLPVLLDARLSAMSALGLSGVPTTLLVDRAGREVGRIEGPVQWNAPDAPAVLGRLLA